MGLVGLGLGGGMGLVGYRVQWAVVVEWPATKTLTCSPAAGADLLS